MELSQEPQEATQPAQPSLRDQILEVLLATRPVARGGDEEADQACRDQADAVTHLLNELGHYLPGRPPAAVILDDAKQFAERLTLAQLALRILNMLAWSQLQTPETKPARKWLDDYLEGKNHGPVGKPMLWPHQLPGMAQMLRDWGFEPTPTKPAFVARALPTLTVN